MAEKFVPIRRVPFGEIAVGMVVSKPPHEHLIQVTEVQDPDPAQEITERMFSGDYITVDGVREVGRAATVDKMGLLGTAGLTETSGPYFLHEKRTI